MNELLWVGSGGFVGAIARYYVGGWIADRLGAAFPYATLFINVSGSLLIGVLMGALESYDLHPVVRLAAVIGFLGAYTTFSTFTYETLRLLEAGHWFAAGMNMAASLSAGMVAVVLGIALGRAL